MSSTQYGIGVTKNRFELFDIDDEDPLEVLKSRELEREARKKTKLSEKENKGKDPLPKPKPSIQRKGIKETQNLKPLAGQKPNEGMYLFKKSILLVNNVSLDSALYSSCLFCVETKCFVLFFDFSIINLFWLYSRSMIFDGEYN